jgi:hypothetical protein
MQPVGPALAGKLLPLIVPRGAWERSRRSAEITGAPTGLFPAKAGPTKAPHAASGTGFSREAFACDSDRSHALRGNAALDAQRPMVDAERQGMHAHAERRNDHDDQQKSQVLQLASSRLKPVLLRDRMQPVGPASAGKLLTLIVPTRSLGTITMITRNHKCSNWPLPG